MNINPQKGEEGNPDSPKLLLKPLEDVTRLVNCLLPEASPVVTQEGGGGIINLSVNNPNQGNFLVMILTKGEINYIRTASEGLLFAKASAPSVLGLLGTPFRFDTYKLVASEGSELFSLPRERAIDLIAEHKLAREALNYHAYIADVQSKGGNLLINKTTYDVVCTLLLEIADLPDNQRSKTSVAQYILERSNMGRSGLMRILADLRKGEYVDIQKGKLVSILRKLPKVY